jgi:hypothetical protein
MEDNILNVFKNGKPNVIHIITTPGPKLKRPAKTIKKSDVFQQRYVQDGNVVYLANLCSMNVPTSSGMASIDLAEHLNSGVFKITYNGVNFAAPTLTTRGTFGTSAAFDLHGGELACQRKLTENGNREVRMEDEISDVAADEKSILITTKLFSEGVPGERGSEGVMCLNDTFVSDIVHTKQIKNVSPGVVDYFVKINVPSKFTYGVVEVLSSTFFNDIIIQLIRTGDTWRAMENKSYPNGGFVIAKTPEAAMGVALVEWPCGAVCFPPKVNYHEYSNVNKWNITQQIGSPINDSIKVPGGEYSWRIRFLFGPIWEVQQKINKIKLQKHGDSHKTLFQDDREKRRMSNEFMRKKHEYGYEAF